MTKQLNMRSNASTQYADVDNVKLHERTFKKSDQKSGGRR